MEGHTILQIPDFNNPEDKILKPLYDRFDLKLVTQYVESRDARLSVLKDKQSAAPTGAGAAITLDELRAMQAEVASVAVPDAINELMDDVLCELREKGIHISDRKYFSYYPLAQARAWLESRDTVERPTSYSFSTTSGRRPSSGRPSPPCSSVCAATR